MIVRSYLEWSLTASAQDRAEAVGVLIHVFLEGEISAEERRDAEAALVLAVNDTSPVVRRVLAQMLGASDRAPRALVAALSHDLPDIAVVVVANSPLLNDAALIDLLTIGDGMVQLAVAQRAEVSTALAAAVAEVGSLEANLAMLENSGAEISLVSLNRLLGRFGSEGILREALIKRDDLPHDVRMQLVKYTADHLLRFTEECGWLAGARAQRLSLDTFETGVVTVAAKADNPAIASIVKRLLATGVLTPQLLLRSLLSGDTRLLTATLADLSETSERKANAIVHGRGGIGFRALYRKAGLPRALEPAFEAALSAWHEFGYAGGQEGRLSRQMVERVLTSVAISDAPELAKLTAVLLRYQAEAAIEEAKETIAAIMAEPKPDAQNEQTSESQPEPVEAMAEQALELQPMHFDMSDFDDRLQAALDEEFKQAA